MPNQSWYMRTNITATVNAPIAKIIVEKRVRSTKAQSAAATGTSGQGRRTPDVPAGGAVCAVCGVCSGAERARGIAAGIAGGFVWDTVGMGGRRGVTGRQCVVGRHAGDRRFAGQ